MIRVVIAEDSRTVRELLVAILESDPEIRVVGQAKNGAEAVELAARLKPDLITMDVHMPVMDGCEATKEIMVRAPVPILIVSSSATGRDVELSLNAMRAGALMVVPKPDDPQSARFEELREELVAMAKAMANVKVVRRWASQTRSDGPPLPRHSMAGTPVRLVAVAASTGGPAALQRLFAALPGDFPVPIVVVQHIASGFVGGLSEWLSTSCNLRVKVAEHGEPLLRRTVYVAPDNRQMGVAGDGRVLVTEAPAVNGFRPSATHLFATAAQAYGPSLTAVILTGMGNDGVEGLRTVKAAGGSVLAQNEASSVVYGMPGEAVAAGVADAVLGVDQIAQRLIELVAGGRYADTRPHR
jgi:two-component system chemotaxis response regulator CheB